MEASVVQVSPNKRVTLPGELVQRAGIAQVEAMLSSLAAGDRLERTGAMVQEHLATGGKQLRARLALAAYAATGGDVSDVVPWAAAVEMLHNATLVHDDIQDGDVRRRGRPTLWVHHGVSQAMNAGDLMLMLPYQTLGRLESSGQVRWALTERLALRAADTVRGQCKELALLDAGQLAWDDYLEAIVGKTAQLIALPVEGSLIVAGHPRATAIGEVFGLAGVAFQIQDDIIDLFGSKGREKRGCDLAEGKVSALVATHLELHPGDRGWLLDLLRTPREQTTPEMIAQATRRFQNDGALDLAIERMNGLRRQIFAADVLDELPAVRRLARGFTEFLLDQVLIQR